MFAARGHGKARARRDTTEWNVLGKRNLHFFMAIFQHNGLAFQRRAVRPLSKIEKSSGEALKFSIRYTVMIVSIQLRLDTPFKISRIFLSDLTTTPISHTHWTEYIHRSLCIWWFSHEKMGATGCMPRPPERQKLKFGHHFLPDSGAQHLAQCSQHMHQCVADEKVGTPPLLRAWRNSRTGQRSLRL